MKTRADRRWVFGRERRVATGATLRAAIRALHLQHPARLIVGVPTAAASTDRELRMEVDDFVVLMTPESFRGVGEWYDDFGQTGDGEVAKLLSLARADLAGTAPEPSRRDGA